jgi:hypothetical protein
MLVVETNAERDAEVEVGVGSAMGAESRKSIRIRT